jgi:hypothetical protein
MRSAKGNFFVSVENPSSVLLRGGEAEEARRLRLDEGLVCDSEGRAHPSSSTSGKRGIEYTVMFSSVYVGLGFVCPVGGEMDLTSKGVTAML